MGHYILHSKDAKLCIEARIDTILVALAQEKAEGPAYAETAYTAENAARVI